MTCGVQKKMSVMATEEVSGKPGITPGRPVLGGWVEEWRGNGRMIWSLGNVERRTTEDGAEKEVKNKNGEREL